MAVLWNLVNPANFDPLGSFQRGADIAQKQQVTMARQSTLAQLANGGLAPEKAATALAAAGDLQGAQAIGTLYGQQEDRKFRQDTSARDFAFRQQQAQQAQTNADRAYKFQQAQFGFTQQQANKPIIVQVEDPTTGIKAPFAFNPLTRQFAPLTGAPQAQPAPAQQPMPQEAAQFQPGVQANPMAAPVAAPQPAAATAHIPTPPPGVDVKEWRKQAAKAAYGQTQAIPVMQSTIREIDQLIANPGLNEITGRINQYTPSVLASDKGRDALARYNQLKGRGFLQAYNTLRGGGQITEVEGKKAQDAIVRMDRSQSTEDFKRALKDFRDAVSEGLAKLGAVQPSQAAPQSAPQFDRGAIEQELRRRNAIQ